MSRAIALEKMRAARRLMAEAERELEASSEDERPSSPRIARVELLPGAPADIPGTCVHPEPDGRGQNVADSNAGFLGSDAFRSLPPDVQSKLAGFVRDIETAGAAIFVDLAEHEPCEEPSGAAVEDTSIAALALALGGGRFITSGGVAASSGEPRPHAPSRGPEEGGILFPCYFCGQRRPRNREGFCLDCVKEIDRLYAGHGDDDPGADPALAFDWRAA